LSGKRIIIYRVITAYAAGAEQILQAAQAFVSASGIPIYIIGDGPGKTKLRALSEDLCLRNVSFLDSVALHELPKFLSIAEIASDKSQAGWRHSWRSSRESFRDDAAACRLF